MGNFSSELVRTLCPLEFRPVYYNPFTVKHLLSSAKDRILQEQRSRVYRLDCADCASVYIGQTNRQLNIRVGEHLDAWQSRKFGESAFSDHLLEMNHNCIGNFATLLHHERDFRKRIALEEIEIVRHHSYNHLCSTGSYRREPWPMLCMIHHCIIEFLKGCSVHFGESVVFCSTPSMVP